MAFRTVPKTDEHWITAQLELTVLAVAPALVAHQLELTVLAVAPALVVQRTSNGEDVSAATPVSTRHLPEQIALLLRPVTAAAQAAPVEKREQAVNKAQALQQEAVKGKEADDEVIGGLIQDLVDFVPAARSVIVAAFGDTLLAGLAGPVTNYVLRRIGAR